MAIILKTLIGMAGTCDVLRCLLRERHILHNIKYNWTNRVLNHTLVVNK